MTSPIDPDSNDNLNDQPESSSDHNGVPEESPEALNHSDSHPTETPNQTAGANPPHLNQDPAAGTTPAPGAASGLPTEVTLIQIADEHGTDTAIVRLIATGQTDLIPQFTYLIADDTPNRFFLQIVTANRNLSRFAPQPFDTISLSQMLALVENRGYATDAIVSNVSYYDAGVNAIIDSTTGEVSTPYIRPTTGTIHRLANTAQIIQYLKLPRANNNDRRIGVLARSGEAEVPINASDEMLNHHILVAGSTGSGKSHLLSNIGHAATSAGRSAIIFDHKPDHQHHHHQNPGAQFPRAYSLNGQDPNLIPVRYWTLDDQDLNQQATMVSIRGQDLDPEILAGTIFHRPNEENQAEVFAHITASFNESQQMANNTWTIHNLIDWIIGTTNGQISSELYGPNGGAVNTSTMNALRRKIRAPGRIPVFIDAQTSTGQLTGRQRTIANISQMFDPGLNVMRISETHQRGYALFLNNLLKAASDYRTNAIPQGHASSTVDDPEITINQANDLEIIIDEASDIFTAESRYLRDAATGMLSEQIRKGRSLHIGYVIAVQSAGDVPENIRNNLNTTIIGRHRNMTVLRDALPTARPGMLEQADKLMPGEMFVDLFGVNSLLLTQMDFSRSQLTVIP